MAFAVRIKSKWPDDPIKTIAIFQYAECAVMYVASEIEPYTKPMIDLAELQQLLIQDGKAYDLKLYDQEECSYFSCFYFIVEVDAGNLFDPIKE